MKYYALFIFFVFPFGISASIEFLPTWIAYPSAIIQSLLWFGTVIGLMDGQINENS